MSSTASLVQFVTGQLGADATAKAMFGEYGIYLRGVLIALFCDDKLFLKPTPGAARLLGEPEMAPPYPGAKPAILVPEDSWEDRPLMVKLAEATFAELPAKAPAKKKAAKTSAPANATPNKATPKKAQAKAAAKKARSQKAPAKASAKKTPA